MGCPHWESYFNKIFDPEKIIWQHKLFRKQIGLTVMRGIAFPVTSATSLSNFLRIATPNVLAHSWTPNPDLDWTDGIVDLLHSLQSVPGKTLA